MTQVLFISENNITIDWLTYIEQEAKAQSQSDEFTIIGYADRELLNPEVQTYLQSEFATDDNEQEDGFAKAALDSDFALSFDQNKALVGKAALFGYGTSSKRKSIRFSVW